MSDKTQQKHRKLVEECLDHVDTALRAAAIQTNPVHLVTAEGWLDKGGEALDELVVDRDRSRSLSSNDYGEARARAVEMRKRLVDLRTAIDRIDLRVRLVRLDEEGAEASDATVGELHDTLAGIFGD